MTAALPDTGLTPYEHVRRHAHNDINTILAAWPQALTDAHARGYPTAVMQPHTSAGGDTTSVENTVINPKTGQLRTDAATAWIAELADIIHLFALPARPTNTGTWTPDNIRKPFHQAAEQLIGQWPPHAEHATKRLNQHANFARAHWPPPPKPGAVVAGTTIGRRGNTIETCGLCQQPVAGGAADPIRRIDGQAFHKSPCWYTVTTSRGRR